MIYRTLAILPIALVVSLYGSEPIGVLPQGWWDRPDDELRQEKIEGTSYLAMKLAMRTAPEKVKKAVTHLKNPKHYDTPEWRSLWLYGPSGTGKSTLSKAIAAYSGFDVIIRNPSHFQTKGRSEAAKAYREFIENLVRAKSEILVIMEESDGMMNGYEDGRNDNAETTRAMQAVEDTLEGNNKIFIVRNSNTIQDIAKTMKTRNKNFICKVDLPADMNLRVDIAMDVMKGCGISPFIAEPVLKILLPNIMKTCPEWRARDWKQFNFELKLELRDLADKYQGKTEQEVKKAILNDLPQAISNATLTSLTNESELDYKKIDLTEKQRQDIAHMQNIVTQALIAHENSYNIPGVTPIFNVFFEFLGLRKPIAQQIGENASAVQKTIAQKSNGYGE